MQLVPLKAVPSQTLNVTLNNQLVTLNVYQKFYGENAQDAGVYVDVYVNNSLIIAGVIAENLNRIVRNTYLGFSGDFAFADAQGAQDPDYVGIGSRYFLFYFAPEDLTTLGLTG